MIRMAATEDLDKILDVYAAARRYMDQSGNPTQWVDGYPQRELLEEDIQADRLYVFEEKGDIHGVFAFMIGDDPTYAVIEEGDWKSGEPYGTIHRLAGDGSRKGLFPRCLDFCRGLIPNIRADTHSDNHTMQHLLEKYGFQKCGIVHVWDGTPRIAYQYAGENGETR